MSNNFYIPFEKKTINTVIGNNNEVNFSKYHYYLKTMNLTSNSLNSPIGINPQMNQTAHCSLFGLEESRLISSKPSVKESGKQSENQLSNNSFYNTLYNQTLQSERTKKFNHSKVIHFKYPNSKHALAKRPTKKQISNCYLAFENASMCSLSGLVDNNYNTTMRHKTKITDEYEKLLKNNQKKMRLNSIESFNQRIPIKFQYKDEIETYKEYLRMVDSKELLKQKAIEILQSFKETDTDPQPNIAILDKKNTYLENAISKITRCIQILSRNNQEINDHLVMNMLNEECELVKYQIDLAMDAYCNIKNFSCAVLNDKEIVLLPLINSVRKLTIREKEQLINRQRIIIHKNNNNNQLKGDFYLKTELGPINEQSNIGVNYNRQETRTQRLIGNGNPETDINNNDKEANSIFTKKSFWDMYNAKNNNKKMDLNPSTIANEQLKWSKSNQVNSPSYHDSNRFMSYDTYNDNRNPSNKSSEETAIRKVFTNNPTPINNHSNAIRYDSEKVSTKRTERIDNKESELNLYLKKEKKKVEKKTKKSKEYKALLSSISNRLEKKIELDKAKNKKQAKGQSQDRDREGDKNQDQAVKDKLKHENQMSKFKTLVDKSKENAATNSDYYTNDNSNTHNYLQTNKKEEDKQIQFNNNTNDEIRMITDRTQNETNNPKELNNNHNARKNNNKQIPNNQKQEARAKKKRVGKNGNQIDKKFNKKDQTTNKNNDLSSKDNNSSHDDDYIANNQQNNGNICNNESSNVKLDNPLTQRDNENEQNENESNAERNIKQLHKESRSNIRNKRSTKIVFSPKTNKEDINSEQQSMMENPIMRKRMEEIQHNRKKTIAFLLDSMGKSNVTNPINPNSAKELLQLSDQELQYILQDSEMKDKLKQIKDKLLPKDQLRIMSDAELLKNYLKEIATTSNKQEVTKPSKATKFTNRKKKLSSNQDGINQFNRNVFGFTKDSKANNLDKQEDKDKEGKSLFTISIGEDKSYNQKKAPVSHNKKAIDRLFNEMAHFVDQGKGNELRAIDMNFNITHKDDTGPIPLSSK